MTASGRVAVAKWAMTRENGPVSPSWVPKIVPVLCAHAQGSRFTDSWHAFEGDRTELHDLGCEYVGDLGSGWDGLVGVDRAEACDLLHNVSKNWD